MSIADWATTISGFLAVAAMFVGGLRWVLKKYLHGVKDEVIAQVTDKTSKIVEDLIRDYLSELKPNHGSSLNDKIVKEILPILHKLDETQEEVKHDVTDLKVSHARLEGRFDQHVDER